MTEPTDNTDRERPAFRNWLRHSRIAVLLVAMVFGFVSVSSVVGFVFNLTINYPGTTRPVIAVDPLWMLGHVIRAVALGALTYRLWRYQSAVKNWQAPDGEGTEQFIKAHAAAWKTAAFVMGLLVVNGVVYVVFGGPTR